MKFGTILLVAIGSSVTAPGQAPAPSPRRVFEVASIKRDKSGLPTGPHGVPVSYVGGRFTATNVTLVDVIVQV